MKMTLICVALLGSASSTFATEALYRCADGTVVRAIFSVPGPAGSARLSFVRKQKPVILRQAPSADGGKYTDGAVEFWIKGQSAQLTRAGVTTECKTR